MNLFNRHAVADRIRSAVYALFIFTYVLIGCQLIPAANALDGDAMQRVNVTTSVKPSTTATIPETTAPPTTTTVKPTEPRPTEPEPTVNTQPIVPTIPPVNNTPVIQYYDVPLGETLQNCIFEFCKSYNVDPSIIVAMIYRESTFNPTAIGDGGNSLGLMQIQPRWFQKRMAELGITQCHEGCSHETCLLNPYQNVALGIDYVAELMASGKSIEWVLMAYNGGPVYADQKAAEGVVTDYAKVVIDFANGLRGGK